MTEIDQGSTTPFHTFDPIEGESLGALADILDAARTGSEEGFDNLAVNHPRMGERLVSEGADITHGRAGLSWDDATILFVTYRAKQADGSPAEPLDRGISMDRLGRFPTLEGNAITYLRENHIPAEDGGRMTELLNQLDVGLRAEVRGHDELSIGFGGLHLHGWLSAKEVNTLRESLQRGTWKVARNERFDGGVRDVVRHLLVILRNAEKRGLGVLMRSHT